eukprot:1827042-Pyramimonas_sp.AAC.1
MVSPELSRFPYLYPMGVALACSTLIHMYFASAHAVDQRSPWRHLTHPSPNCYLPIELDAWQILLMMLVPGVVVSPSIEVG